MNILIINPFGIGDVLFTTPLVHTLKESIQGAKIGFLCNKRTQSLLNTNPHIDYVFVYERDDYKRLLSVSAFRWLREFIGFIMQIKKRKFDMAIDLSLTTNFGFFAWLAGIKTRIGYNYKKRGFYLTKSLVLKGYENKHIVQYYDELLYLIGIKPKYKELELYLNQDDITFGKSVFEDRLRAHEGPVIAIAPGGGASWGSDAALKHWPEVKYIELIDKIIEKYNAAIIMLGDYTERESFKILESKLRNKIVNLVGLTSIGQGAAIINLADLLIANDGGLLHIAVALKKKTISLFGPVDPQVYGPYPKDENRHKILSRKLECSPCYKRFRLDGCFRKKECLEKIDVDEVLKAAGELLD